MYLLSLIQKVDHPSHCVNSHLKRRLSSPNAGWVTTVLSTCVNTCSTFPRFKPSPPPPKPGGGEASRMTLALKSLDYFFSALTPPGDTRHDYIEHLFLTVWKGVLSPVCIYLAELACLGRYLIRPRES